MANRKHNTKAIDRKSYYCSCSHEYARTHTGSKCICWCRPYCFAGRCRLLLLIAHVPRRLIKSKKKWLTGKKTVLTRGDESYPDLYNYYCMIRARIILFMVYIQKQGERHGVKNHNKNRDDRVPELG